MPKRKKYSISSSLSQIVNSVKVNQKRMNNLVESLKEKFEEIKQVAGAGGSASSSADGAPLVAGQEGVAGGARGISP